MFKNEVIHFQKRPTVCAVVQGIHITRLLMVNGSISWAYANILWLHQRKQANYLILLWKLKMNLAETLGYPLRGWSTSILMVLRSSYWQAVNSV